MQLEFFLTTTFLAAASFALPPGSPPRYVLVVNPGNKYEIGAISDPPGSSHTPGSPAHPDTPRSPAYLHSPGSPAYSDPPGSPRSPDNPGNPYYSSSFRRVISPWRPFATCSGVRVPVPRLHATPDRSPVMAVCRERAGVCQDYQPPSAFWQDRCVFGSHRRATHPSGWFPDDIWRRQQRYQAGESNRRRRQALKARLCSWWREYLLWPGEYLQRRSVLPRFPAAGGIRHKSQSVWIWCVKGIEKPWQLFDELRADVYRGPRDVRKFVRSLLLLRYSLR